MAAASAASATPSSAATAPTPATAQPRRAASGPLAGAASGPHAATATATAGPSVFQNMSLPNSILPSYLTKASDARFVNCNFARSIWPSGASLDGSFERCTLSAASLSSLTLDNVSWTDCRMDGCLFRSTQFCRDARFERCDLRGAVFDAATFYRLVLIDCVLDGASFVDAFAEGIEVHGSSSLRGTNVSGLLVAHLRPLDAAVPSTPVPSTPVSRSPRSLLPAASAGATATATATAAASLASLALPPAAIAPAAAAPAAQSAVQSLPAIATPLSVVDSTVSRDASAASLPSAATTATTASQPGSQMQLQTHDRHLQTQSSLQKRLSIPWKDVSYLCWHGAFFGRGAKSLHHARRKSKAGTAQPVFVPSWTRTLQCYIKALIGDFDDDRKAAFWPVRPSMSGPSLFKASSAGSINSITAAPKPLHITTKLASKLD
ncbi:hypothetical protein BC831DRAFT_504627 [Entophlyctis helioformis]|nr:hypothetical protein BC831DRAFT_504627 [Entophlyctis helioformis]